MRNALEAGCMTEGAGPFFEAIYKMRVRPPWAIHFLPENIKFSKLKKEMERTQQRFLRGDD